jgi:hypothetical protein
MDSTTSPKVTTMEGEELGHVFWLTTLQGWRGMMKLRDED